jgi:alpha-beta hydrolase superfamily lysophospholipase
MIGSPLSRPVDSYADALDRASRVMARDHEGIAPAARTMLLEHGEVRSLCVVLLHGFTNNPAQYAQFAPQLYELGANVYVPRFPRHGHANRMTTALESLTADELVAATYDALDIAQGLGKRVAVLGISMGGLLAAHAAQFRYDVDTAVPIAPDFALLHLPYYASRALAAVVKALPNVFMWWDPRIRMAQQPPTAYPRYPTHALMETLRIGDAVFATAKLQAPRAARTTAVVNAADPAVNNTVTRTVAGLWRARRPNDVAYVELQDLPRNHDIIDPDNPLARTDLVYPKLIEALRA